MPPGPKERKGRERLVGEDYLRVLRRAARGTTLEELRRAIPRYVTDSYFARLLADLRDAGLVRTSHAGVSWIDPRAKTAAELRFLVQQGTLDIVRIGGAGGDALPWGLHVARIGIANRVGAERKALAEAAGEPALARAAAAAFACGRASISCLAPEDLSVQEGHARGPFRVGVRGPSLAIVEKGGDRFLLFR